jgi:hypothetical protein
MEHDERICRKCGETVKRAAKKCPLCGIDAPAVPSASDKAWGRMGCLLIFVYTVAALIVLVLVTYITIWHNAS